MKIMILERFELQIQPPLTYPDLLNTRLYYDQFDDAEAAQEQVEKTV
jgi:hypothetical protein